MILAGLQKSSLIDYPGKVSCVVFVAGCNFHCPYCHNPDLVAGRCPDRFSDAALRTFLAPRRAFLDGVVITGGEPTLQPELTDLCRSIGKMGLAVKLDTNGSRPDVLQRLIESRCIDYLAMDLKTDIESYGPPLCREPSGPTIKKSIGLIMNSGLEYEFRTTCVRPFVDEAKMVRMAHDIRGAQRYILQRCNPSAMLDPSYFQGTEPCFSETEMAALRQLAAPMVASCRIR
jgi:pyruvate formate lyase activating enzyme